MSESEPTYVLNWNDGSEAYERVGVLRPTQDAPFSVEWRDKPGELDRRTKRPGAWQILAPHVQDPLRLYAEDPDRFREAADTQPSELMVEYLRLKGEKQTINQFLQFLKKCGLRDEADALSSDKGRRAALRKSLETNARVAKAGQSYEWLETPRDPLEELRAFKFATLLKQWKGAEGDRRELIRAEIEQRDLTSAERVEAWAAGLLGEPPGLTTLDLLSLQEGTVRKLWDEGRLPLPPDDVGVLLRSRGGATAVEVLKSLEPAAQLESLGRTLEELMKATPQRQDAEESAVIARFLELLPDAAAGWQPHDTGGPDDRERGSDGAGESVCRLLIRRRLHKGALQEQNRQSVEALESLIIAYCGLADAQVPWAAEDLKALLDIQSSSPWGLGGFRELVLLRYLRSLDASEGQLEGVPIDVDLGGLDLKRLTSKDADSPEPPLWVQLREAGLLERAVEEVLQGVHTREELADLIRGPEEVIAVANRLEDGRLATLHGLVGDGPLAQLLGTLRNDDAEVIKLRGELNQARLQSEHLEEDQAVQSGQIDGLKAEIQRLKFSTQSRQLDAALGRALPEMMKRVRDVVALVPAESMSRARAALEPYYRVLYAHGEITRFDPETMKDPSRDVGRNDSEVLVRVDLPWIEVIQREGDRHRYLMAEVRRSMRGESGPTGQPTVVPSDIRDSERDAGPRRRERGRRRGSARPASNKAAAGRSARSKSAMVAARAALLEEAANLLRDEAGRLRGDARGLRPGPRGRRFQTALPAGTMPPMRHPWYRQM